VGKLEELTWDYHYHSIHTDGSSIGLLMQPNCQCVLHCGGWIPYISVIVCVCVFVCMCVCVCSHACVGVAFKCDLLFLVLELKVHTVLVRSMSSSGLHRGFNFPLSLSKYGKGNTHKGVMGG